MKKKINSNADAGHLLPLTHLVIRNSFCIRNTTKKVFLTIHHVECMDIDKLNEWLLSLGNTQSLTWKTVLNDYEMRHRTMTVNKKSSRNTGKNFIFEWLHTNAYRFFPITLSLWRVVIAKTNCHESTTYLNVFSFFVPFFNSIFFFVFWSRFSH